MVIRFGHHAVERRTLVARAVARPRPVAPQPMDRRNRRAVTHCAAMALMARHFRDHRLAADHRLTLHDQGTNALGQIQIRPAAEADDAEAVAGGHRIALAHRTQDAAGDQAGDLHHRDLLPVRQADRQGIALVRLAGLVQAGADEGAVAVGDAGHDAIGRHAVDVHIQHRKEDRHLPARLAAQPQFRRRRGGLDRDDAPVGRRQKQARRAAAARAPGSRKKKKQNRVKISPSQISQVPSAKPSSRAIKPPMMNGRPAGCGGARTLRISSVMAIRRGVMEGYLRRARQTAMTTPVQPV